MTMHFQRNAHVEAAPLQEEMLLFQPQTNAFCVLNRTASFLWTCLAQPTTAEQLVEELRQHFEGVAPTETLQDVQSALQQLQSLELVIPIPQQQKEVYEYGNDA